jgi:nitroimidazol reductase NimA-like FMN-containing flavoprotein (pyridoxamine 5'-phosphate oxidase superfamily)
MAYLTNVRIDIEPVNYVFDAGRSFLRTSTGWKTNALAHRPWVACEVDEIDGPFDWRSVVVRAARGGAR